MADADRLMLLIGGSVRGPQHERAGGPNEDAVGWRLGERGGGARLIAAVADGHGSERCPRSAKGSQLAVSATLSLVEETLPPAQDPARQLLATVLVKWRDAVDEDLRTHPLDAVDRAATNAEPPWATTPERLAYGTTLLLCAVAMQECLIAQVGDGHVVAVDAYGASWLPMGQLPGGEADVTDSLCLDDAGVRARCSRLPLGPSGPALLLLVTDGCSNAYPDEAGMLQVGTDLLGRGRAGESEAGLQESLDAWLGRAAAHSGDDASCVAIWTGSR